MCIVNAHACECVCVFVYVHECARACVYVCVNARACVSACMCVWWEGRTGVGRAQAALACGDGTP